MESLVELLKFIGPELAFPAMLIFGVLWFLLKVLKPMFTGTNETFKAYLQEIREIRGSIEELKDIRKALEDIARNHTRDGKD